MATKLTRGEDQPAFKAGSPVAKRGEASVTRGNRDDRGREGGPSAAASGRGNLGPGYRGEAGSRGGKHSGGPMVEGLKNFGAYEPRHTSKTR